MGRIRILPDNVANKIAAGEVVERPASVVKELLENSIDAGSARIRIQVEAGGKRRIQIVDDGAGMVRDDAMLAFERHATSKLRDADDLLSIDTLGFRGEALPSIAAVSRLTLETRSPEERSGTRIEIAGGKLLRVEEAGLPGGTSIIVSDLFYNTPARRKFLRAESTELSHITSLVTHYSLAYPERSFHLSNPLGDLILVPAVASLRDRVFQLLGGEVLEELVEFGPRSQAIAEPAPQGAATGTEEATDQAAEQRSITLHGFVSRPQIQKLNRNSIYLFVNRRLVRDRTLLHAIQAAYHNLMPAHSFPVALLFLELPYEEVDVNVHPAKVEVRFRHSSFVHDWVHDTVRQCLTATRPVSTFPVAGTVAALLGASPSVSTAHTPPPDFPVPNPSSLSQSFLLTEAPLAPQAQSFRFDSAPGAPSAAASAMPESDAVNQRGIAPESLQDSELTQLRPLGQVRESFVVAASPTGLWLIDQHAAHERVLFERFLAQRANGAVQTQRLLMPYILRLTPAQQAIWGQLATELESSGFETEPFGQNTIAVKAAPADVKADDVEKLLHELVETLESETRGLTEETVRNKIAASVACHAAIKINTPLEPRKMEWLLAELAATRFPMSCPHGRPVILKYGMREILKAFHRT
ncbi:MAG: DNA mismatch repair endonuclease MutL [Acidobacteria bacterium]|nr:DNA mismatch repair endonuclease MutL [Acidobacteriota bacterium]